MKIMKPPEKRTNFDFEFLVVNTFEFEEKPSNFDRILRFKAL